MLERKIEDGPVHGLGLDAQLSVTTRAERFPVIAGTQRWNACQPVTAGGRGADRPASASLSRGASAQVCEVMDAQVARDFAQALAFRCEIAA